MPAILLAIDHSVASMIFMSYQINQQINFRTLSKWKIIDEDGEEVMKNFQKTFKPELSGAKVLLVGT